MATFDEVLGFVQQNGGKVGSDSVSNSGRTAAIEWPIGGGRTQIAFLGLHSSSDSNVQLLTVFSPICSRTQVSAENIISATTLFGVTATKDSYCLVTTVNLGTLDVEDLLVLLSGLLGQADDLEKRITGADNL